MFSSFWFQRILRIQNPVYMYIYVFFLLFPKHSENTEHSIHVHLCFLPSVSREYWEYRTQYICTSMFYSFCFKTILRIQNPLYRYIYVFFFLFPENTENIRTQYTCTYMFSSFCFQRIQRIQNPVYMYRYIYVFFFLFPENTENTEPTIHVHLCFLLSISRKCWEYRTQYTCTSMFSSFCFQRKLTIQNPVYMYIYVFFFLFLENAENTEPSIHVHLFFLVSVSRDYWTYRT